MAVIYARLSQTRDPDDTRGVERQIQECRRFAETNGWTIQQEYVDNDTSATSGRRRPAFEQMLADRPERIVVWHTDRLVRKMADLERVIGLDAPVHAVQAGHIDLSNSSGRMVARMLTSVAAYEGEHKAERQRSSNLQRAQAGVFLWSARRPYGFDRDGHEVWVVPEEAEEIRRAAKQLLKGATLTEIAKDWNRRGVRTTLGKQWRITQLRRVLLSPRTAGRIDYRGQDYGPSGLPILDQKTAQRVQALLNDPTRRTAPSTQTKHLLSGLARCGRCGTKMFASTNTPGRRGGPYQVLVCQQCRLTRHYDRVEQVVLAVVTARLRRPDLAALLMPAESITDLRAEVTSLRTRRDAVTSMLARGLVSPEKAEEEAGSLNESLQAAVRRLEALTGANPIRPLIGAPDPADAFLAAPLSQQRKVISALMGIRIMPAGKGVRFSPEQVEITWH